MFLRGVNAALTDAIWKDPEAAQRTARYAGSTGNAVGSYQTQQFLSHRHSLPLESGGGLNTQSLASNIGSDETFGDPAYAGYGNAGGLETRPNNANVNYIIKY